MHWYATVNMQTQMHADERGHNLKTRPDARRLFKDFRDALYFSSDN